jgi:sporulation protein YlmC with PRC-barrel domain
MNQLQNFLNSPVNASSIIGTSVVDPEDKNLGSIKEIVIDPASGRVACQSSLLSMTGVTNE